MSMLSPDPLVVFAVVFGSYDPPEVCEIYDDVSLAQRHARQLNREGDSAQWHAVAWQVRDSYTEPAGG
jgi:hypothetical protein